MVERLTGMLRCADLGTYPQSVAISYLPQPLQTGRPDSLKPSRLAPGFPDPCSKAAYPQLCQCCRGTVDLLLALDTARTGKEERLGTRLLVREKRSRLLALLVGV